VFSFLGQPNSSEWIPVASLPRWASIALLFLPCSSVLPLVLSSLPISLPRSPRFSPQVRHSLFGNLVAQFVGYGTAHLLYALEHLDCQFRLGLEAHRLRNMGGQTSLRVLAPVQGQIQLTVNQAMSTCRDVAEKDADLTLLDLPGGSTILRSHPSRLGAPLGKPAFIDDQDRHSWPSCSST
jgi:hypothetical protein